MNTTGNAGSKNNLTAPEIIRRSGLAAMLAGILFIVIQMMHPADTLSSVNTNAWTITHYLTISMSLLALVGITGIFVRQLEHVGWLGLAGYLLFSFEFVLLTALTFIEAFILPLLTTEAPTFVEGFLGLSSGAGSKFELGALVAVGPVSAVAYLLGGLLFGIATLRAGILSRAAAGLLAFGAVASLAAAVLPHELGRIAAFPMGLGLVWLGYSLWSEKRI
ncbi:hypothetical protein [Paenibacillus oryzisoli]|uniref:DUF4386 domain-containing protein n=1 Tax=Paenibacillus oryzisoli TaxID=1850517 RepID=A0A198AJ93_9BACL|nr:hypothetical protein [Paenibacillus oryzisoli]OAS21554.1 hypothetical protein A8708_16605 [Paenibacillus oryzisoli]